MNDISYNNALVDVKHYMYGKVFKIYINRNNHVRLYHDSLYVNNYINNLILFHHMRETKKMIDDVSEHTYLNHAEQLQEMD